MAGPTMRSRLRHLLAVVGVLTLAATGCGRLDRDAVQTEVESVESAAAEGAMVAYEVERRRTFRSFAVIRTAELHKVAMNVGDELRQTPTERGLEHAAMQGMELAQRVAMLLEQLHERPTDPTLARDVRLQLHRLAGDAGGLADRL
jgi:hypothetical protein